MRILSELDQDGRGLRGSEARQRGYDNEAGGRDPWYPGRTFDLSQTPALRWMDSERQPLVVSESASVRL